MDVLGFVCAVVGSSRTPTHQSSIKRLPGNLLAPPLQNMHQRLRLTGTCVRRSHIAVAVADLQFHAQLQIAVGVADPHLHPHSQISDCSRRSATPSTFADVRLQLQTYASIHRRPFATSGVDFAIAAGYLRPHPQLQILLLQSQIYDSICSHRYATAVTVLPEICDSSRRFWDCGGVGE